MKIITFEYSLDDVRELLYKNDLLMPEIQLREFWTQCINDLRNYLKEKAEVYIVEEAKK